MPKPRPQVPPLPLLNGYAAAVTSNNQLNQRRQQLATSRSSGAIPCTNMAVPLAQINTSMRRYSAAAAASTPEYFMDPKNVNLPNGAVFNRAPYPLPSTMLQLPYNADLNKDSESSKLNMREYSSSVAAQFNNSQANNMSDACSSASFQVGMKEVPSWLKGLRLHKYTQLFQQMSYVEMMGMDDQQLEHRQVTKGARKKILQSIQKLRERVSLLKQLEACIDENGDTRCLIFELRAMMSTPIWSTSNENQESLPHHICRILQRLHNHLFDVNGSGLPPPYPPTNSSVPHSPLLQNVSSELSGLEDEYVVKLIQTYDKVVNHEAFTPSQKQVINQQRRVLRMYAQQQYIQYSNPQFRHFSSIPNHSTANINNKSASNIVRAADWMVQPPYKSPGMHSSMNEHHQHRHSLMHIPNQESSPATPLFATVGMAGIKNNRGFSTSHSRFAGLEGTEKISQMTETEHRNGVYAEKGQLTQQLPTQQAQPFWPTEHPQRPPPQVSAMAKPPPQACFSQPIPAKNWPEKTETNVFVAEKASPAGCWTDLGDKKRVEEQRGWSDVGRKMEQASSQLSYPQLLLSMLSSMPEFRDLLEKSIYSKNNSKKASMQTAATQTGHEPRFQETALNNPTVADRPLTAEEKLQFVNEFFIQNSPEKEMQINGSTCWQQSYSEILAKQVANLQLANQQQEAKSKPVLADTYGSAFDAWIPLTASTGPVEPIHEPILPVKTSFQSSLALSQPSLSLSNISSGYSSSTCSETERASSPGLMVYNFNDCSKCSSKLFDPELPSICPSFEKCAQVAKEDTLSALANLPESLDLTDSAIRWYEQLSPSGSFNQNRKTEPQQPPFAYTSPPPTLFFSQVGQNPYPNMVKESTDWRQQLHTNNNPIYDQQQTMWFGEPTHRLTKHSPSPLRQNSNATTQQQHSTHLWSAAPEMRAVH